MKILVIVKSILDTNDVKDKGVKFAIENSALNKTKDNLAGLWAIDEANRYGSTREITLELP